MTDNIFNDEKKRIEKEEIRIIRTYTNIGYCDATIWKREPIKNHDRPSDQEQLNTHTTTAF